jgi:ribosome-associated protein
MQPEEYRIVHITGELIRLGALLKLADIASSGGEAKALLAEGAVLVNGATETRRGRQLHDGDTVEVTSARPPERLRVQGGRLPA